MNLAGRIKTILENNKMTVDEFAEKLEEKSSRITDILREKQRVPSDILEKIVIRFDVNANWLLTGNNPLCEKMDLIQDKMEISKYESFEEEFALVRAFDDIHASAGYGAFNVDTPSCKYLAFRRRWLSYHQYNPNKLIAIWAKGDSMEPTIANHTSLLVNMAQKMPIDGGIFVIRQEETLWVKRVQIQLGGDLLLISDNSAYPPILLEKNEFDQVEIIGQVVYLGRDV